MLSSALPSPAALDAEMTALDAIAALAVEAPKQEVATVGLGSIFGLPPKPIRYQVWGEEIDHATEQTKKFFTIKELAEINGNEDFETPLVSLVEIALSKRSAPSNVADVYAYIFGSLVVRTSIKPAAFAIYYPQGKIWTEDAGLPQIQELVLIAFASLLRPWLYGKLDGYFRKIAECNSPLHARAKKDYEEKIKQIDCFIDSNNRFPERIVKFLATLVPYDGNFPKYMNDKSSFIFPLQGDSVVCFDRENGKYQMLEMSPIYLFSRKWNVRASDKIKPDFESVNNFVKSLLWKNGEPPNEEDIKFFWRLIALSLSGQAPKEKMILFFTGGSDNGKSTLCNVIEKMIGDDYVSASEGLITRNKFDDSEAGEKAMYMLVGKRLAVLSEPGAHVEFSSSTIKRLTGDDSVCVKGLYKNRESVKLDTAIWVLSNNKPKFDKVDIGLMRRVRHVHFAAKFVEADSVDEKRDRLLRDPKLVEKVMSPAGLRAFFAFMLQGLKDYLENGLGENDRFDSDTGAIMADEGWELTEESVKRFFTACCERGKDHFQVYKELFPAYAAYCQESGLAAETMTGFSKELTKLGFAKKKVKVNKASETVYYGFRLRHIAAPLV